MLTRFLSADVCVFQESFGWPLDDRLGYLRKGPFPTSTTRRTTMFRAKSLIAALIACLAVTSIGSAQFIAQPLIFRRPDVREGDERDYAALILVPPSVYTTGDPMPLGTRVEFRIYICERNQEGELVLRLLEIVSGGNTYVGAPLHTTLVSLPDLALAPRLAVTAVAHGSESRPRIVKFSEADPGPTPVRQQLALREFSRPAE
jgi:hypothetical protein